MTSFDPFDENIVTIKPAMPARHLNGAMEAADAGVHEVAKDIECARLPLNDFGNAQRLMLRFGPDLLFVKNVGWYAWQNGRWAHEGAREFALQCCHKVAEGIKREARAILACESLEVSKREDRRKQLYFWAQASGNHHKALAMLSVAEAYLMAKIDALDRDAYLIAALNGTIRLGAHCELLPSRRDDFITNSLGAAYNPNASCPLWMMFLERVLPDPEIREFLRRIAGYCLTGSIKEHKLFLLYGAGRNGKSTFVNVLRKILAEYAIGMPVGALLAKRDGRSGSEPSPDLARLPGARIVTAAEPPEGARLDESRVKEITGGDVLTVRHLNQGFFEYSPLFKVMLSTNHLPTIRGSDQGIWARVCVVPFSQQIPDDEIDRDLEQKLLEEKEGILQWILTGVEEWFAVGLNPPAAAAAEIEAYRADQDPVGEFLKAKCEICPEAIDRATGRQFEITAKRLYEKYCEWCIGEKLEPFTPQTFGRKVAARGLKKRKSGDDRFWLGLHLNEDPA